MRRKQRSLSHPSACKILGILGVVAMLAACGDLPLPSEPGLGAGGQIPASKISTLSDDGEPDRGSHLIPGQISVFLGVPPNSNVGMPAIDAGGFSEPTLVEVRAQGIMQVLWEYISKGQLANEVGPNGFWYNEGCAANIVVTFSQRGIHRPCRAVGAPFQEVVQTRMVVQGNARITRNGYPRAHWLRCGGLYVVPCYTFAGGHTVTITPIADQLQVEADTNVVAPGREVKFTASTGDGTPFQVREWIWVEDPPPPADEDSVPSPGDDETEGTSAARGGASEALIAGDGGGDDTGPVEQVVCGTEATCGHAPQRSGTMYVRAVVGGVVQQASVGVEVDDSGSGSGPGKRLVVTCEPSVISRGGSVLCHAKDGAGEAGVEVLEWFWTSDTAPDTTGPRTEACTAAGPICETQVYESGTMFARALVEGVVEAAGARVQVAGCTPESINIVGAAGPNPGGSFLALAVPDLNEFKYLAGENVIKLEANTSGACSGHEVYWEVEDHPHYAAPAPEVGPVEPGLVSSFSVPSLTRDSWPSEHAPLIDKKKLVYQVRAYVEIGNGKIYSAWRQVEQDPIDVIRQEYLAVSRRVESVPFRVPYRWEFREYYPALGYTHTAGTYAGDYCTPPGPSCKMIHDPRLWLFLDWLAVEWQEGVNEVRRKVGPDPWLPSLLEINGLYRNPVHHHVHLGLGNDSPHKYGVAVDLQTFPRGDDRIDLRNIYWEVLRNLGLEYRLPVCAEPYARTRWTHVHFDLRDEEARECHESWLVPEVPGARSATGLQVRGTISAAADTMLARLRDPDWSVRAAVIEALARISPASLPSDWKAEVTALLDREAESNPGDLALGYEDAHAYGEYLMDLVNLAVRTDDSRAVRSLTRIGIDVGVGARQFVAKYPDQALPALEERWAEDRPLRAAVIATVGEMLGGSRLGHLRLTPAQRSRIDLWLAEAVEFGGAATRRAFAFLVRRERLAEWLPVVEMLAAGEVDAVPLGEFAQVMARRAIPELEAATRDLAPAEHLNLLLRLHTSICTDAKRLRHGNCTSLGARLQNAARMLGQGNTKVARNHLEGYRDDLGRSPALAAFTPLERRLLAGNAKLILDRL